MDVPATAAASCCFLANSFESVLNDVATGADYVGLRYFLAFLLALFATVRVVLPIIVDLRRWKREGARTTMLTESGPVTYEAAFREVTSRLLHEHSLRERCERHARALEERNRTLAAILVSHGFTLPPDVPPLVLPPPEAPAVDHLPEDPE